MSKVRVEIQVRVDGKVVWKDLEKVLDYIYRDKVEIGGKMQQKKILGQELLKLVRKDCYHI